MFHFSSMTAFLIEQFIFRSLELILAMLILLYLRSPNQPQKTMEELPTTPLISRGSVLIKYNSLQVLKLKQKQALQETLTQSQSVSES